MRLSAPETSFDKADFKGRLTDEYKILQDKIDKIGGFRFTIKGWSVTAVVAASAVGSTASLLTLTTISIGLALMLCFFFWFEFKQVELSRLFGDRARRLEDSFRRVDRGLDMGSARMRVPYTAHEIALASYAPKASRGSRSENLSKRYTDFWHVARQADVCFYFALICVAFLLLLVPRHRAIGTHWKQWTGKSHSAASAVRP